MLGGASGSLQAAEGEAEKLSFSRDVQPILAANCLECHGPDRNKGGISFEASASALAVGDSGEHAVVPGDPGESEIIRRVTSDDRQERMPPPKNAEPLSEAEVAVLRRWIEEGAEFEPHWSFTAPKQPSVPEVQQEDWARSPIDRFVLAKLEEAGFQRSPQADRYTLVRRLYLDLIGLAPTPEQADAFVNDESDDAYERLVDELLASPHFGERWGRHWLDLARYAESDGFERDYFRPGAWRWRDWVVRMVNEDQPYDAFLTEQLAGDLLKNATTDQRLATGFYRNELQNTEGGIDVAEAKFRKPIGQLNAVGTAMMGLTVACAECHTHKFDPIKHDEYYQMLAFFWGQMDERDVPAEAFEDPANRGQELHYGSRGDDQLKAYLGQDWYHVVVEREEARPTHVRLRGVFHEKGELVEPGVPEALPELEPRDPEAGPDRLDFARWLTSEDHPLTARVAVNQFWAKLMGEGLVATMDDFGVQGERPSHPELLDWLALDFMENGWSRKRMVRQIVLSSTYRQSSTHRSDLAAVDRDNRLLGRQYQRRAEAEVVRDHALAGAGLLETEVGGPSFHDRIPDESRNLGWGQRWHADDVPDVYRRSIYMVHHRNTPVPMMPVFDQPDAAIACTKRDVSETPLQTLTLWNARIFVESAQALGVRTAQADREPAEAAQWMWRQWMTRPATERELAVVLNVYEGFRNEYEADAEAVKALLQGAPIAPDEAAIGEAAAWTATARMLLGLDQTMTRE